MAAMWYDAFEKNNLKEFETEDNHVLYLYFYSLFFCNVLSFFPEKSNLSFLLVHIGVFSIILKKST